MDAELGCLCIESEGFAAGNRLLTISQIITIKITMPKMTAVGQYAIRALLNWLSCSMADDGIILRIPGRSILESSKISVNEAIGTRANWMKAHYLAN